MLNEFKEKLLSDDIRDVYQRYLLGHDIWYFREQKKSITFAKDYDEFKLYMSKKLEIHVNNIAIVGSAKMGFSLSPDKNYRTFNDESDIDLVLVSDRIYKSSWMAFIELQSKNYFPVYAPVAKNIFKGFVSLKELDIRVDFFNKWSRNVEPLKKDIQTIFGIPNDINYRIYDSWESVERYHIAGLNSLKDKLQGQLI
ncbi:TPA: hypothetical protein ACWKRV_002743 [Escherichia coli]|uniref:hypothetical protein n=1 Tax=Escherichia coli TaxID=562 RepID=UPI000DA46A1A|nr:hypothetical protein [Escherichia coli]EFD4948461.1 hypothetical protein [Escherichia coli]EFE8011870.1 hypothetical protein [Escherichia coli]QMM10774.1 hypothetical protein HVX20_09820 [Escherichia coli]QMM16371.1 hypothetical protein HVX19_09825 [Escherichia coli]QMM26927.1 hypothetical protein HVX17_09825 [Escherichia coli]